MVLSLLLAVVIWSTVSIVYSPETGRTISQIPVEINFPDDNIPYKAYSEITLFASVEVSGKKYVVEQLSSDSLVVSASVDSVTSGGLYTLDLEAKKRTSGGDFSIGGISPSTVTVMIDVERTLELDVAIECVGATVTSMEQENQNILLEPSFVKEDQQRLTVSGPDSVVSKIHHAVAVANVNKLLTKSEVFNADLVLYNESGSVLYDAGGNTTGMEFVTMSYTGAEIEAGVHLRKVVPLNYKTNGAPDSPPDVVIREFTGSDTQADNQVSTVSIKGDVETIEGIDEIVLDGTVDYTMINASGSSEAHNFKLTLPAIAGVVYDEYQTIDTKELYFLASVDIQNYTSRSFDIPASSIQVDSVSAGYTAQVQSALKGVTVVGPVDRLDDLTSSGISVRVSVDNTNTSGAVSLVPVITVKGDNRCWITGSYQVVVELKK